MGIGRKEENPIPPLNVRREPGGTELKPWPSRSYTLIKYAGISL